jgi:DHA2 family methylenomycin A resistance protein-like MFS transporter
MCAGYFLVLLDVTIVNVAVPKIGTALHATVSELQWVVDAYALALASLMLAAGTLGDRHGHKRIVLAGLALFGAASAACGAAPSAGLLVAARAVQGVGASLMLPGTLAVITNAYPDARRRARAIGTWAAIGSIALPAGPLLGGALIDAVGWRAIFFLNLPVCALAFAGAMRTVTESRERITAPLDLAGLLLGVATLAALTLALIARLPVAGGVALVTGAAFVAVERTRAHPMLPLGLFRHRDFSVSNAVAGTMNLVSLGLLFVVTLYLQDVRHRSALSAGLDLLPLFGPLSLIAPFSGRLAAGHGSRRPMIGGLLVAAAGLVLLAHAVSFPALLLWGIGLGFLTPAVVARAVGSVPRGREGLASAVNNAARQAGGVIGIAAFGALAGTPGGAGFVTGLHAAALIGAGLFVAAAVASGA